MKYVRWFLKVLGVFAVLDLILQVVLLQQDYLELEQLQREKDEEWQKKLDEVLVALYQEG